ncbi:MAG: hypothetical protein AB7O65_14350, partial [Candidatus Korobacteraceae bacterium]
MIRKAQFKPVFFSAIYSLVLCAASIASAEVVRVEITEESKVLDGKSFGAVGPYVRLVGKVYFAVDPQLAANHAITDVGLAPRNANGRVEFSSDLYLLKPLDPAK